MAERLMDDHELHLAIHRLSLLVPEQVRIPVRPWWRRWWRRATFRSGYVTYSPRKIMDDHIRAHEQMMDEISGISDISRGRADD